jgi:hypothetical protein
MLISVSEVHQEKALAPIVFTELGIVIEVSDRQLEKAPDPIVSTELGIVIEVSAVLLKASPGISVTLSETITFLNKDKASVLVNHAFPIALVSLLFD